MSETNVVYVIERPDGSILHLGEGKCAYRSRSSAKGVLTRYVGDKSHVVPERDAVWGPRYWTKLAGQYTVERYVKEPS